MFPILSEAVFNNITVSGNPATMTINSATAGSPPNAVSNNATTYTVETDIFSHSITGQLNTNMPSGMTLSCQLAAPPGATSQGSLGLTTSPVTLVTNVNNIVLPTTQGVTYSLSATTAALPVSSSVIVTFTITP